MKIHKAGCSVLLVAFLVVVPSLGMEIVDKEEEKEAQKRAKPKKKPQIIPRKKAANDKSVVSLATVNKSHSKKNDLKLRAQERESRRFKRRLARDAEKRRREEERERKRVERKQKEEQEREEAQRKKEEREQDKKKAFWWGVGGFIAHTSAGLGIGYAVNTYEGGGGSSFFKNVLKPMVNSFLTKQFIPLGGLYFSKYAFLQIGDMLTDLVGPTQDATKVGLKDTIKELKPEATGILNDVFWQVGDFIDECAEQKLPFVLNEFDDRVDGLIDKIPEAGEHVNQVTGKVLEDNTKRIETLARKIAEGGTRGMLTAPFGQSEEELEKQKKHFQKNDKTFDVAKTQSPSTVVGTLINRFERKSKERSEQGGGKKKKKK